MALGARGQANTLHRHFDEHEIYVRSEGTGRLAIGDEVLTVEPLDAVHVEPDAVRQVSNGSASHQLWLMLDGPKEPSDTLEMTEESLAAPSIRGAAGNAAGAPRSQLRAGKIPKGGAAPDPYRAKAPVEGAFAASC
ncbi:MAG: cupin domain-containing protein [Thermoleophilia bacterium]|nr:cupin domain-containing protein [Thermoleophilia bacterium]MDH3725342.1 cupin domain-containing protein [Thermoleophilia bacterium]